MSQRGSAHLWNDGEAQSCGVHHHRGDDGLQGQGGKVVGAKHQRVALHAQVHCDLVPGGMDEKGESKGEVESEGELGRRDGCGLC